MYKYRFIGDGPQFFVDPGVEVSKGDIIESDHELIHGELELITEGKPTLTVFKTTNTGTATVSE